MTLSSSIVVGGGPDGVAYDNRNGTLYVSNKLTDSVSIISGSNVDGQVSVGGDPWAVVYDSQNGYVYVPNWGSYNVSVILGSTLIASINVGSEPYSAIEDASDGYVYVPNYLSGNVSVIDGTILAGSIDVGGGPIDGVYDPQDGYVYITNAGGNLSIVAGTHLVGTLAINCGCSGAVYDRSNGYVYVPDGPSVVVVNGTSVVATVLVGGTPRFATYDEWNGYVYVADPFSKSVYILNGTTLVGTVGFQEDAVRGASYAVFDNGNGNVYVMGEGLGYPYVFGTTIGVINGTKLVQVISGGVGPCAGGYDPANGNLYVANGDGNNVTVVSTPRSYTVSFQESGLPPGVDWSASLSEIRQLSRLDSDSFLVPNGTYTFRVGSVEPYAARPQTGNVIVNGTGRTLSLTFARVDWSLSFSEHGLPAGTNWFVGLGSTNRSSTSSLITFVEANGSYPYLVTAAGGYAAYPPTGAAVVNGANTSVLVSFVQVTYSVTFREAGLPSGTSWSVALSGTSLASASSSITFPEPNGSYPFELPPVIAGYGATPVSGTIVVDGTAVTRGITFALEPPTNYTVTFTESGLPSGTTWSVSFLGSLRDSRTTTIAFPPASNGTYGFTVGKVGGYNATPPSGMVTLNGANLTKAITFTPVLTTPPQKTSTPLIPPGVAYGVVGASIVAILVIVGAVVLWKRGRRARRTHDASPAKEDGGGPPASP
jgi:DNA-binding beta-propeller fold protein YncE